MNRAVDQPEPNPLREGLSARAVPQPCAMVIFGATGDLTHRKLIPALYNLWGEGLLAEHFVIVGVARRALSLEAYRDELGAAVRLFSRVKPKDDAEWARFARSIEYVRGDFEDAVTYQ